MTLRGVPVAECIWHYITTAHVFIHEDHANLRDAVIGAVDAAIEAGDLTDRTNNTDRNMNMETAIKYNEEPYRGIWGLMSDADVPREETVGQMMKETSNVLNAIDLHVNRIALSLHRKFNITETSPEAEEATDVHGRASFQRYRVGRIEQQLAAILEVLS